MRATLLFAITFFVCHSFAHSNTFIFKSGKSIQGSVRYEDASTIRIMETSGLEMTLRKSELNLAATAAANAQTQIESSAPARTETAQETIHKPVSRKVYTNRDLRRGTPFTFVSPTPESKHGWQKTVARLEREFVRLQGACRGAGTGPNLSKIWRSHTYSVNGKPVRVTGYWADPANIEQAKQICERAIETEGALEEARLGFQAFLNTENRQKNSLTAR